MNDLDRPDGTGSVRTGDHALAHLRVVLVGTSHAGNVGSVARAMKTMGLSDLRLVAPVLPDVAAHREALSLATGASDLLDSARYHASLEEALADTTCAVALTARRRDIGPPLLGPEEAARLALANVAQGGRAAFVFGNERVGLDNADVGRCDVICTIPTNANYSSLNLAMAVQIVAYECRRAAARPAASVPAAPLASLESREQMYRHLEEALVALHFLDPDHHTKLMGKLRRMFARAGLEPDEINIMRGICTAIMENRP